MSTLEFTKEWKTRKMDYIIYCIVQITPNLRYFCSQNSFWSCHNYWFLLTFSHTVLDFLHDLCSFWTLLYDRIPHSLGNKKKFITYTDEFCSLILTLNINPQARHLYAIFSCSQTLSPSYSLIIVPLKEKSIHNLNIRQKESSISFEFHIGALFTQPI